MERRPVVEKLIEVMERVASGDFSARANLPPEETEFGWLASTLDKMLDSIASKHAELRETYETCELIFRANPLGIGIYDPQGHLIRVNRTMCKMLGYTEEELFEFDPTHPDDREEGIRLFRELVEGKRESYTREKRYIRKDGTIIWAELTAAVIRDEQGNARYIVIMVQDITERKKAEQALCESERKFRLTIENAPDPIAIFQGTKIIYANPVAAKSLGYTVDEMLSMNFWDFVHPDMQEEVRERGLARQRGEPVPPRHEVKVVTKTGEERWVDYTATLIELEGQPAVVVIAHDITDLKRMQEALVRYSKRLEVLRAIDRSILESKPIEEIVGMTFSRIRELMPCKRVSVMLTNWDKMEVEFMVEDPTVGETFKSAIRLSLKGLLEVITTLQRGEPIYIHDVSAWGELPSIFSAIWNASIRSMISLPMRANGNLIGILVIGAGQPNAYEQEHIEAASEIAHQLAIAFMQAKLKEEVRIYTEHLEEMVAERTKELERVNAEMEHFVATLAHDFRAPLMTIHGFAQALLEDYGDRLDETGKDFLQRIIRSSDRLSQMITELRAYIRVRGGEMVLQPIDLEPVVRFVLEQLSALVKERDAQVQVHCPLPKVMAQEGALVQVLQNLISNAIKFVPLDRTPQVRIWAEERGEWVRVWVEDNGIGILPEDWERIFKPFERLHRMEYSGMGLGLTIVRTAIERMNGRIGVESEVGKGSKFWFELKSAKG
ncbi:MAG: PAS domain S-box protein [Armatimonadetes bacterium]|nr:PAS domain S-box protein [Armatimonadota bacterium]